MVGRADYYHRKVARGLFDTEGAYALKREALAVLYDQMFGTAIPNKLFDCYQSYRERATRAITDARSRVV